MTFANCRSLFALALALGTVPSCSKPDRVEIKESRPRHANEPEPRVDVSYEDAFPAPEQYRWKLPSGWQERPATQFRRANFSFGPNGEGECYLSLVEGSVIDNINRWCAQMGQPAITDEQIAELPAKTLFGRPGRFVELRGTYTGAMGAPPKSDYGLLGLVVAEGGTTITVKMTGPQPLVEAEKGNLDAFCASLRLAPGYPK